VSPLFVVQLRFMERVALGGLEMEGLGHDERVVAAYLKYGSVDEILRRQENLKIYLSQAGIHRLISKWGVVKAAGPNTRISEAVYFLEQLAFEKIPLETLYRRMPPSFRTSAMTLHRILSYVKGGVTRRVATGLVITKEGEPEKLLVARDISTPRMEYGKFYGAYSLPMGFSKKGEGMENSVLRVLQQEVFSRQVVERKFPLDDVAARVKKIVDFDVIDIRLSLYHLVLPYEISDSVLINSYKLTDYRYLMAEEILVQRDLFRAGVPELCQMYIKGISGEAVGGEIPLIVSDLNLVLCEEY